MVYWFDKERGLKFWMLLKSSEHDIYLLLVNWSCVNCLSLSSSMVTESEIDLGLFLPRYSCQPNEPPAGGAFNTTTVWSGR
jgi:hypothetical protein